MKNVILAAVLTASLAAPAAAQMHGSMSGMSQAQMQQMQQMHRQLRSAVLAYLTPEHKALLGRIAAELATSADPNYDAAASRLDAALSPGEKQNIMTAANAALTKMQSMRPDMRTPTLTAGGVVLMLAVGHPDMPAH